MVRIERKGWLEASCVCHYLEALSSCWGLTCFEKPPLTPTARKTLCLTAFLMVGSTSCVYIAVSGPEGDYY